MMQLEKVHPLQSGVIRMKHPSERRPGFLREGTLAFYSRYLGNLITRNARFIGTVFWILGVKRRIERDPHRHAYTDQALTPVGEHEDETYDHMTKTAGAKAAIDHLKKVAALTH
jgi:hypothetical protein